MSTRLPASILNEDVLAALGDGAPGRRFSSVAKMEDFLVSEFCKYACSPTINCALEIDIDDEGDIIGTHYAPVQKINGESEVIFLFPDRLRYFMTDRHGGILWGKVQGNEYVELSFGYDEVHPEDLYAKERYLRDVYIANFDKIVTYIKNNSSTSDVSVDWEEHTIKYRLSGRLGEGRE